MSSKSTIPRCPATLKGGAGKRLWKSAHREFEIVSEHELQILVQACACLDRMAEADTALNRDGVSITDRFGQRKEHPAVESWCKFSRQFMRAIRELGLSLASEMEPYPRSPGATTSGRKRKG